MATWYIRTELESPTRTFATSNDAKEAFDHVDDLVADFVKARPDFTGRKDQVDTDTGYRCVEIWRIEDGKPDDLRTVELWSKETDDE